MTEASTTTKSTAPAQTEKRPASRGAARGGERRSRRPSSRGDKREPEEFEQKIIDLARVTRVMAGGKRMRFRACVAIGDKKGRVGIGLAKSADVSTAISKATDKAKKDIITVQIVNGTIAHEVRHKFGAAQLLLKPAKQGRGIIAGGAVRIVLELAGISNVVSKILGTNNKVTNVKCAISALQQLKHVDLSS